jgi:hypothetical protein
MAVGPLVGFWPKPDRSVGRVEGIIETCKNCASKSENTSASLAGRVLTNKQTMLIYLFHIFDP